jgi:hypothetical protein
MNQGVIFPIFFFFFRGEIFSAPYFSAVRSAARSRSLNVMPWMQNGAATDAHFLLLTSTDFGPNSLHGSIVVSGMLHRAFAMQ